MAGLRKEVNIVPTEQLSRGFLHRVCSSGPDDMSYVRRRATATRQAILIVGSELPPTNVLQAALAFDEVLVLARAIPDPTDDLVVDEEVAYRKARERLARTTAWLRAHGARAVRGAVGDAGFTAARRDAAALAPRGFFLN
jgi:hypothetical protein